MGVLTVLMRLIVLTFLAFLALPTSLSACSVPVFRFALERWAPDLYEVSVFYRGSPSDLDQLQVTRLEDLAVRNGGALNLEVVRCNLEERIPDDLLILGKSLSDAALPAVVVRTPRKAAGQSVVWQGRLSDPFLEMLATSRARSEIASRLLQGDSVVWLLVRGSDSDQAQRARQTLDAAIAQSAEQLELPAGIGRPGSEVLAKAPLRLKFSVVEFSGDDREELVLLQLLRSTLPQPLRDGDSLIAPIFGRGRVLTVQSAREIEGETITDLTSYLCGACSCQVKQQNPGFDLLCAVNWEEQLFGAGSDPEESDSRVSSHSRAALLDDSQPTLLPIPAGYKSEVTGDARASSPSLLAESRSEFLWAIAALGAAAVVIALTK